MKKYLIVTIIIALLALAVFYFSQRSRKVVIDNKQTVDNVLANNNLAENDNTKQEAETIKQEEIIKEQEAKSAKIENPVVDPGNTQMDTKQEVIEEDIKKEENELKQDFKIINKYVSWGYQSASERKIDTVIIHSSYNALGGDEYDTDKLIKEYKKYGVAPHYLIDRKGNIYQLVKDKNIAYHAGESKVPDGRVNVNNFSVGIELMNTKTDEYTAAQYDSLNKLFKSLKNSYEIKYVLGHSQIAPGRKDDPWNFDFDKIK